MSERGFTLIELMITVAIVAFIALVGIPITGQWVQSADIEETEAQLIQALGRAKASGLRNSAGKTGAAHVSMICVDTTNNLLQVRESTSATDASCGATPAGLKLWSTNLDTDIAVIDSASNPITCMCTNNKGLLTSTGSCTSCYSGTEVKLSAGSKSKTVSVF